MGRTKLNRVPFPGCKVNPETLDSLRATAIELGYTYGDGAAMGEFLDRIATLDRDLLKLVFKKST
jgi:hypothetical protein